MSAHLALPPHPRRRNSAFVKRVVGFANRAGALPGFPTLPVAGLAATIVMTVVGAFGTGAMPIGTRAGFWAVLTGWNIAKWQGWFAWRVRTPADWGRAAAIGAVLINLPLPIEIPLVLRLFGVGTVVDPARTWIEALAISAALFAVIFATRRRRSEPVAAPSIADGGLLARAGIAAPQMLHAIEAEDHYCRLHLAGGRSLLILGRFGDALAEVADFDGAQVHRGAWVAAGGVAGAVREGRRWRLVLADGARISVSARFAGAARTRGWLRIRA